MFWLTYALKVDEFRENSFIRMIIFNGDNLFILFCFHAELGSRRYSTDVEIERENSLSCLF